MSATRPAIEFSIGIMPRSALPLWIAASASSKVAHGTGSHPGYASRAAISEFAPRSPWNAIFSLLIRCPYVRLRLRSIAAREQRARFIEMLRRIHAEDHIPGQRHIDAHAGFERAQLFEPFALFQQRGRQRNETRQRGAAVGVKPDVVIERTLAGGRGRAGEIQRA